MSWTQTKKHNKQNFDWKKEILNEEKPLSHYNSKTQEI